MCLATSQIGYSWIVLPQTLPPGYVRFLNQHGGKQDCHYGAVRVSLVLACNSWYAKPTTNTRSIIQVSDVLIAELTQGGETC